MCLIRKSESSELFRSMKISVKTLDSQTKVFTVSEEVSNALLFDIYTFILHTYISFMVFGEVLC